MLGSGVQVPYAPPKKDYGVRQYPIIFFCFDLYDEEPCISGACTAICTVCAGCQNNFQHPLAQIRPPPSGRLQYFKWNIRLTAECEIIHSVNCEISHFVRCEMKFAHIRVSEYFTFAEQIFHSEAISLAHRAHFVEKSTHCLGRQMCAFFWWGMVDSDHRSQWQQIYSLPPLAAREIPHRLELVNGVEPSTCWLQISCSAIEPHQHILTSRVSWTEHAVL